MNGYLSTEYAKSLSEFGTPLFLKTSGTWILKRQIKEFVLTDAMGGYPLFFCNSWSKLKYDLENFNDNLVSLSLVTDPFGEYSIELLKETFKDVILPFKQHFVIDLNNYSINKIPEHHKRNIKKANKNIKVEVCENPSEYLNDWIKLYDCLIKKHDIHGIRAFSKKSFEQQLKVPGLVMFRAVNDEKMVGIILWYVTNGIGYYHLAAYNETGYEFKASYSLFDYSIKYFSGKVKWLNLGAGAGLNINADDGLSRFKKGWANEFKTSYFCGKIFNKKLYDEIAEAKSFSGSDYFPIYRKGEFS